VKLGKARRCFTNGATVTKVGAGRRDRRGRPRAFPGERSRNPYRARSSPARITDFRLALPRSTGLSGFVHFRYGRSDKIKDRWHFSGDSGDTVRALGCVEAAMRQHDPYLEYVKTNVFLDPLGKEPRFQAIERELKFPD